MIKWDQIGERTYETGVENCALYLLEDGSYGNGVAWNGITGITEKPSGATQSALYADNIKYLTLVAAEDFGLTIEAYTYPAEWKQCDGSAEIGKGIVIGQQARKVFGLAYKTKLGNDSDGQDHAYKWHLIYGAQASPSERAYKTVNDSPEAITFSWEATSTPVTIEGFKPAACLTIDSDKVDADELKAFEAILIGSEEGTTPRLPLPDEIITSIFPKSKIAG